MQTKDVIRMHRSRLGLTEQQLADRVGVSRGSVQQWEKGTTTPKRAREKAVADALGITVEELLCLPVPDQNLIREPDNLEPGPDLRGSVPLISWVQAGYGVTAVDNLHPGEGERIETTYKARRHTYALRVKGDSMEPKFPQGCIVIVEPEESPIHGKYVIVRRNGDEPTLKQYIEEGGNRFLKPVNPRYPIEMMQPSDAFCGVVKRLEQDV